MYVLTCYERKKKSSLTDYILWRNKVVNPNYNFYYDLTFSMFMAITCFRSVFTKNNSKFMLADREVASPLFYVGKHRICQNLIIRDLQVRVSAPRDVLENMTINESYSLSGDETKGEDGDYIMEHFNRVLKQHSSPGVPTLSDWRTSSRCDEPLKK